MTRTIREKPKKSPAPQISSFPSNHISKYHAMRWQDCAVTDTRVSATAPLSPRGPCITSCANLGGSRFDGNFWRAQSSSSSSSGRIRDWISSLSPLSFSHPPSSSSGSISSLSSVAPNPFSFSQFLVGDEFSFVTTACPLFSF
jgi:hypothetical protein